MRERSVCSGLLGWAASWRVPVENHLSSLDGKGLRRNVLLRGGRGGRPPATEATVCITPSDTSERERRCMYAPSPSHEGDPFRSNDITLPVRPTPFTPTFSAPASSQPYRHCIEGQYHITSSPIRRSTDTHPSLLENFHPGRSHPKIHTSLQRRSLVHARTPSDKHRRSQNSARARREPDRTASPLRPFPFPARGGGANGDDAV